MQPLDNRPGLSISRALAMLLSIFVLGSLSILAADSADSVGRPDSERIGTVPDDNAITLARYVEMFDLDFNDAVVAANLLNRAVLDFQFTEGDVLHGLFPDWLERVFKIGGAWGESVNAWYVPAGESGQLCLVVDRTRINVAEFQLVLEFYDGGPQDSSPGSLFVDLVDSNEEVLVSSYGNLLEGSEQIVQKAMIIPLVEDARGIYLRARGEIFVLGALLVAEGAGETSGGLEVPDHDIEQPVLEQAPPGRGARPVQSGVPAEPIQEATASAFPPLRASTVSTMTLTQFAMSRMTDTDLVITRCVLDGSGARQASPFFILEDSFAQAAAIGFSSGGNFSLRAGFQQAEAEQIEFWNVSVLPAPFQGPQRRFTPFLGETANFSYELSTEAREVTVRVLDQNDVLVRTLVAQQRQNRGLHTVAWDGRDNAGNLVPASVRYTFNLSAVNHDGVVTDYQPANINEVRIQVVDDIPVIRNVADQPDPFFPVNGNSTISYQTAAATGVNDLDMTVEIFADSLAGPSVRQWDFNNQAVGNNNVVWDGNDAFGINVPEGLYVYSVRHRAVQPERANSQSGAIMLLRANTQTVVSQNSQVEVRHAGQAAISINPVSPAEVSSAMFAIRTADPGLLLQSLLYRIEATPSTTFDPPALIAFRYPQAITGDIGAKLQIRRYNETTRVWDLVPGQFGDYANHQILAEIGSLSLYALFMGEDTTPPIIQIISPEAREYYQNTTIDIIYEVTDPVVGGASSGVAEVFVYLNGVLYQETSIPPSTLPLGENVLTVVAFDGAGNIGRATVSFTIILEAHVTLKPEALNVNPGVLTAFVSLPPGYPAAGITSATCDGALYERMMLNDDATEMIIKFRRQDIEAALAAIGETIDIYFVVRGAWKDAAGVSHTFQGADSITKIVGK